MVASHREGIITLIPKPGKPSSDVKGWRPISLLNVDFKIISSAIAERLKSVMDILISPQQSAYLKGRYIGENSRLVYDIIESLNNDRRNGLIVAADFEAAFESVSWNYLMCTLDAFNFGPYMTNLIKLMYFDCRNYSRILLDGFLGEKIFLYRGIRQGDPASGYLFNLAVQPLANQILRSQRISGIRINSHEVRLSQYADDLISFIEAKNTSLSGLIYEMQSFAENSGLRLNIDKTKCLPIGSVSDDIRNNQFGVSVVNELRILGILFNSTNEDVTSRNLESKIANVKKEIAQWKRRYLTPIGKITVIKSLLLSKFVHILMTLPPPTTCKIKEIESMFYDFLWQGRKDLVKRTKMVQDYGVDGLKMVDLSCFIKSMQVTWMKRLLWSKHDWAVLIRKKIPTVEDSLQYGSKKIIQCKNRISNRFWESVLSTWTEFLLLHKPNISEILSETIWFSDLTKFKKSIVKEWNDKGIRFIGDLIDPETGILLNKEQLYTRYNVSMTFLCYSSIKRSLPKEIQFPQERLTPVNPVFPYKLKLVSKNSSTSKLAYTLFVKTLGPKYQEAKQNLRSKWVRDVGMSYEGSMSDVLSVTRNTSLLSLHFRLISRIITTNTFLHVIGKSESWSCTFCKNAAETLVHMFWRCSIVQTFIKEVTKYLKENFSIQVIYDEKSWFFPTNEQSSKQSVMIGMIAKQNIYRARNKDMKPSLSYFINTLKCEIEKENYIAIRNNKLAEFSMKWGRLDRIIRQRQQINLSAQANADEHVSH